MVLGVSPDLSFTLAPVVMASLALYTALYVVRWRRVRATHGVRGVRIRHLVSFAAGMLTLAVALISPVDGLAEQLAVAHMVQHLLLVDIAPILFMASLTKIMLRPVSRALVQLERAAGPLSHPAAGVVVYCTAMVLYHVPAVYDLTLRSDLAHVLAHILLVGAGLTYWWHLISPARQRGRLKGLGPVVYMVSTKLVVGLLAAGIAFSPRVLWKEYERLPEYWGLDKLTDQQVAGLLMGLEQSVVMGIALVVLLAKALGDAEKADARQDLLADADERPRPVGGAGG